MIDNIKAKDEEYKKMKADLQLAKEREKGLMKEMESKNEEIQELKKSVEHWKKKAESRNQEGEEQVKQHSHNLRDCYVNVQNVKAASPPCS